MLSASAPCIKPVRPPMENRKMKESAKSMGGSRSIEPLYRVAIQLKTLMAEGTATRKVSNEKITSAVSLMPLVNMWCAPDQGAQPGDGHWTKGDRLVAEDRAAREGRR